MSVSDDLGQLVLELSQHVLTTQQPHSDTRCQFTDRYFNHLRNILEHRTQSALLEHNLSHFNDDLAHAAEERRTHYHHKGQGYAGLVIAAVAGTTLCSFFINPWTAIPGLFLTLYITRRGLKHANLHTKYIRLMESASSASVRDWTAALEKYTPRIDKKIKAYNDKRTTRRAYRNL